MKFLIALIVLFTSVAFADDFTKQCGQFTAPLTGGYCIYTPVVDRSRDVLYVLHGHKGSQLDWEDPWNFTEQIRQEWKARRARRPTVISLSFGSTWLLAEKNASPYSGLFEALTQQVMPSLEKSIGGVRGRRIVMGISMGGFNTVQLALKTRLFNKAAALCAPMSEVSPFASNEEIETNLQKSSAYQYWKDSDQQAVHNAVFTSVQLAKGFYPTQADFDKANPLVLAANSNWTNRTALYVTAGFYDVYALYEGNQKFVDLLRGNHMYVEWHPMWGGHCVMDIPSLSRFLVN